MLVVKSKSSRKEGPAILLLYTLAGVIAKPEPENFFHADGGVHEGGGGVPEVQDPPPPSCCTYKP